MKYHASILNEHSIFGAFEHEHFLRKQQGWGSRTSINRRLKGTKHDPKCDLFILTLWPSGNLPNGCGTWPFIVSFHSTNAGFP